jgi:hypothetical protein
MRILPTLKESAYSARNLKGSAYSAPNLRAHNLLGPAAVE